MAVSEDTGLIIKYITNVELRTFPIFCGSDGNPQERELQMLKVKKLIKLISLKIYNFYVKSM